MSFLKKTIKSLMPFWLIQTYRSIKRKYWRRINRGRPVKEVFTHIYQNNLWGGIAGEYSSGSGSTEQLALSYADVVKRFAGAKQVTSIVDLGCGDFTIGSKLQMDGVKYIGVDIVDALIDHNREKYGGENIAFYCLDIISDPLPEGDLCLIRQVLQHLSHAQISLILDKIKKYKYVLITEHYPAPSVNCVPNLDKPHGPDTRIHDNSAVFLDQPPFNIGSLTKMLEVAAPNYMVRTGENLVTFLIEN